MKKEKESPTESYSQLQVQLPPPPMCPSVPAAHDYRFQVPSTEIPNGAEVPATSSTQSLHHQNVTLVIARTPPQKSLCEAYMLCLPLGILGLHHFYLRRYGFGFLYFFTLGLCGIGWIVDLFRLPCLVKQANHKINHPQDLSNDKLSITDAYILWFPLGIIGLHHYYLRRPAWGIVYTFTCGFFLIGWIVDSCRIPSLVHEANRQIEFDQLNPKERVVLLCDAYALGLTPVGLFGAHHFYMGRFIFGMYYLFTLGGFGIGWIVDWFRMKVLVDRANNPYEHLLGKRHKFVDDAYVMAFPAGFLGFHHFYLERPGWGTLYFFTLGLFGIGWLIDLCRMPCLVSETNKRLEDEMAMMEGIRQQLAAQGQFQQPQLSRRDVVVYPNGQSVPNTGGNNYTPSDFAQNYCSHVLTETPILQPPPYEACSTGNGHGSINMTIAVNGGETAEKSPSQPPVYSENDNRGYQP